MKEISSVYTDTDIIPMRDWGEDHWSTLAYIETVMVDLGGGRGFQIGLDPRMRSNRRNFRVMFEQCKNPQRGGKKAVVDLDGQPWTQAEVIRPEQGSILFNRTYVPKHDDWCCIQDMAEEGLLTMRDRDGRDLGQDQSGIEPGHYIRFTERGRALADRLRAFKAAGGTFKTFHVEDAEVPA